MKASSVPVWGRIALFALLVTGTSVNLAMAELDANAALEVLKRNDCTKCHSVKKSKNGPSYQKVSEKYKGDGAAEDKIYKHLTTSPKVKLEDGTTEEHKKIDITDPGQLKEFIRWILSL
ncbi:MAG: cytochrome C [Magnetococcales bacterium]|nr:cytochrome C [Magnetococcales bacterium]NGZ29357.1 cytochrome C [Magnetococcales bacterium]